MDRAPDGQPATQAPQAMHLDDLPVSGLTVGMCHGQASWQAPQPMHLSVSTTRMPRLSVVMAFCGQALPQAGSSHWRQVSGK